MSNLVRASRRRRDWTQAELAVRVGTSRQAIIEIEKGRALPSLTTALALARCLATDLASLFPQEDEAARIRIEEGGAT